MLRRHVLSTERLNRPSFTIPFTHLASASSVSAPSTDRDHPTPFMKSISRYSFAFLICALLFSTLSCGGSESASGGSGSVGTSKGGQTSASSKPPDVDACSLVTRADAEAIMGKLREAPKPTVAVADEKTCSYLNMNGANVTVRIYGSDWYDIQKNLNDADKIVSLPGMGEEAYYVKKSSALDLWVRKGNASLYLNGTIGLEPTKRLAAKILSRL